MVAGLRRSSAPALRCAALEVSARGGAGRDSSDRSSTVGGEEFFFSKRGGTNRHCDAGCVSTHTLCDREMAQTGSAADCVAGCVAAHTLGDRLVAFKKSCAMPFPLVELQQQLEELCDAIAAVDPLQALAAAASVHPLAWTCSLLRRLEHDDACDLLLDAAARLIAALSGQGEHTLSIPLGRAHPPLQLRCAPNGTGTGSRVWRSAHVAIAAIDAELCGLRVRGRRVVELGCGTAAVGLACAAYGADAVLLLDYDASATVLAAKNARLNGLESVANVARIDLTSPHDPAVGVFDVVVASDLCYDFLPAAAVARAIAAHMDLTNPESRALIVHDLDNSRSDEARRAVSDFAAEVGAIPALRCVARERTGETLLEVLAPALALALAGPGDGGS